MSLFSILGWGRARMVYPVISWDCVFVLFFSSSKSGSDGLLKLWTIKTNECVKTLDGHEDKIWGLHSNKQDDMVVTASSDSSITLWKVQCRVFVSLFWVTDQNAFAAFSISVISSSLFQHDTCCPHFMHLAITSVRRILDIFYFVWFGVFWPRWISPVDALKGTGVGL